MPRPAAVPQAGAAGPLVHLEGNVIGGSASVEVHQHLAAPLRPERVLLLGPRPPVLVGREDLLAEIGRRLARRPAADERPLVVAVHGLGGVGKTSLAAEYVHRHAAEYGVVCRLPAQDPAVLAVAFADLAVALGVRNDSTQNADPVKQVHAALADRATRWMLFLDNVEDPSHALRELIPPVGDGGVLVTSRSPDWPRDVGLEVDVLPVSDGAPLLLERSGDTDADAARAVAEALGGLPLALEQAAGYVRTSGRSLRAYRDLLASHRAELLARGRAYDYPGTLAATWDLALDRLRVEVPGSVALLSLLACWAPDAVPLSLLLGTTAAAALAAPGHLPAPAGAADGEAGPADRAAAVAVGSLLDGPFALEDAVLGLHRYSLIRRRDESVSIHRLVQAVTSDRLPAADAAAWRRLAGQLVEAALPTAPRLRESWSIYARLLAHARSAVAPDSTAMQQVIDFLDAAGDYVIARTVQADRVTALTTRHGGRHPLTLQATADLARLTGSAGDPVAARDMLAAVVRDLTLTVGADDDRTLTAAAEEADWLGQCGDWTGARDHAAGVLAARLRVSGDDHLETLRAWGTLGFWTGQAGDPATADNLYDQFLPALQRALGDEDAEVLARRDQHARWAGERGDTRRALSLTRELAALHETRSGPDHPGTLWVRANLAWWIGECGDPTGARDAFEDVVTRWTAVVGYDHPATFVARANLAWWTGHAGNPTRARDLCAELLTTRRRIIGPEHPEVLLVQDELARWTAQAGDPASGCAQYEELIPVLDRVLGASHDYTLAARRRLAQLRTGQPIVDP